MGWFSLSRSEGFPTQYSENVNPVTIDVLESGLIAAFVILAICFLISLPSTQLKNSAYILIRVYVSLFIGLFILLSNFGQEWEVGHISTKTPYRSGTGQEINASVGLKIGLRGINVTLKSIGDKGLLVNEVIDYNERFEWIWDQGRFGFGPYAGHLQQQFRAAQYRGLPLPILWVVEYFIIDGEGFRFGRFYRTAGWYTHILVWTAFPCWLLANILFRSVIRYGAYFLGLCGFLLLFANLIWLVVRNPIPLVIPFENATLVTHYGFSYWLTLFTGLLCLLLSAVILYLETKYDVMVSIFFGVDPLISLDEYVLTPDEVTLLREKNVLPQDTFQLREMSPGTSQASSDGYIKTKTVYLKRRSILGRTIKLRKARPSDDEQPLYGNQETIMRHQYV